MKRRPCCTDDYGPIINGALLLLRVLVSVLIFYHGLNKLNLYPEGVADFPDPFGMGSRATLIGVGLCELIFPFFILVGYKTRMAVLPLILIQIVALFFVHGGDPVLEHINILLYLLGLGLLLHLGAGGFSLTFYQEQRKYRPGKTA